MCVQADIVLVNVRQGSTWTWASKCTRVCVTLCSPTCFMLLVGAGGGGRRGPGVPVWTFQPPGHV